MIWLRLFRNNPELARFRPAQVGIRRATRFCHQQRNQSFSHLGTRMRHSLSLNPALVQYLTVMTNLLIGLLIGLGSCLALLAMWRLASAVTGGIIAPDGERRDDGDEGNRTA